MAGVLLRIIWATLTLSAEGRAVMGIHTELCDTIPAGDYGSNVIHTLRHPTHIPATATTSEPDVGSGHSLWSPRLESWASYQGGNADSGAFGRCYLFSTYGLCRRERERERKEGNGEMR